MKFRISVLITLLLILNSDSFSQYVNFRVFPSSNVQIEPLIAKSRAYPQELFIGAYTLVNTLTYEGVYISTNSGANWYGYDQLPNQSSYNDAGDAGPIIDKNNIFILTHLGFSPQGMFSNRSTDLGVSWSNRIAVTTNNQEKGSPGTDDFSASPFYGRSYVAWTLGANPFNIILSYTTNSANSWSPYINVNSSLSNHQSLGAVLALEATGKIYASWAAAIETSPFNETNIGFAYSTNGGVNWTVQESAYTVNGIKTTQFGRWNIRVNGYPQMDIDRSGGTRNGWIYIVEGERNFVPNDSADVIIHHSTDGGTTWSAGTRVNQDPPGRFQFYPAVAVDDNGGVNVVYYDNRNTADSMEVWLSRSTDGGATWHDYKVSDHRFLPKTAYGFGPGLWGDHIGIECVNNKLIPVWMADLSASASGKYQVWTAIIDVNTIGVQTISNNIPSRFTLGQNYPNPFNPTTRISFDIPHFAKGGQGLPAYVSQAGGFVSLIIYDLLGREIATLVNEQLQPGTYEVEWQAADMPSGAYFYKLTAGDYTQTRKMVLLK